MGYVIVCGRALCVLFCFVLFGELFVCFFNYFLHFGLFSGFDMLTKFVSTTSTNMFSRASLVIWAEGFDLLGRGGETPCHLLFLVTRCSLEGAEFFCVPPTLR